MRPAVALIVVGIIVMGISLLLVRMHRGNESTMYWFGLGGALTVVGVARTQRR